ncbi:hypothetical protein [Rhodocista pekingensis]|uniref:STAS domain-containing protein n=1 Tax=Rhodocista pekingensis TaxID=201185 RepID=A0ABW2L2N4_9PROT
MIVHDGAVVRLEGHCAVEEAETLLETMQNEAVTMLDLGRCQGMHTAVLQLIRASGVPVVALPADALLAGLLSAP